MKKFIKSLRSQIYWVDLDLFWITCFNVLILATISIGIQSLLLWIGTFPYMAELHIGTLSCGMILNTALFIVVLGWAWRRLIGPDTFIYKGTTKKGWIFVLLSLLGISVIYIDTAFVHSWSVLAVSIIVLILCRILLAKLRTNTYQVDESFGITLMFCVGTYVAMLINSMEPAIDVYGITTILLFSIVMIFITRFS